MKVKYLLEGVLRFAYCFQKLFKLNFQWIPPFSEVYSWKTDPLGPMDFQIFWSIFLEGKSVGGEVRQKFSRSRQIQGFQGLWPIWRDLSYPCKLDTSEFQPEIFHMRQVLTKSLPKPVKKGEVNFSRGCRGEGAGQHQLRVPKRSTKAEVSRHDSWEPMGGLN